ncbi:MAG: ATP-binding cassette domain-containing protein [Candidatus Electrothrix sp. AR4]|nr:ATP-binding cassette domain-containing protein [Candidatus Electrothrix sp. AR4]
MDDKRKNLIEASGLKHSYQVGKVRTKVLHGIDLTIRSGENVFLTGLSGSGKTTLISLIGCLRTVQEGSLKVLGEELRGAKEAKLRKMRRRIGYVFQQFNLLDFMTIRQNVQQSLKLQNTYTVKKARLLSEEMLDRVGLGERINAYPAELSGGQKQRVAIARALVHRPRLVLADEPTAALDSVTGREIIELFQQLAMEQNSAALIVTHNIRALENADEIYQMKDGYLGTAAREQLSLALPTLNDHELEYISEHSDLQIYPPGHVIIRQGDIATAFFILIRGEVEILHTRQDGKEKRIALLDKRGDYFGEIGLLQKNARRAATVRTTGLDNAEVLVIGCEDFLKMVEDSKMTQSVIKDEMAQRLARL